MKLSQTGGRSLCWLLLMLVFMVACPSTSRAQVGEPLPLWSEGQLDIHHINTGKGDAAFFILPDGTTLLVDAGAHTRPPGPREMPSKPNDSRTPGEWISRYIRRMLESSTNKRLDYALLTHFHSDHMGGVYPGIKSSKRGPYKLSGITEVGELLPIGKIIDRGWPNYEWPTPLESDDIRNYRDFLTWHMKNNGLTAEQFRVGVNDQIVLLANPSKYPEFEIRNIAANGHVWTGVNENVRNHFPALTSLKEDFPSENMCSIALRLSYGRFDYFTGGDLPGVPPAGAPVWHDVETPIAKVVGPVEVNETNHHAYFDAQNAFFISALRPRVHIIQSWVVSQPAPGTFSRLLSTRLYPGPRDIFATNIREETRIFIGSAIDKLKSQQGHIVIRVEPKGETFRIFILDDSSESFTVRSVHGPYQCE